LFRFNRTAGLNLNIGTSLASDYDSTLATVTGPSGVILDAGVAQAMKVPAVARAVQLYVTAAAKLSLVDGAGQVPKWLGAGAGAITPGGRIAATVQDLFFHGKAVFFVRRDAAGNIVDALLLPPAAFALDVLGRVTVSGKVVPNQAAFVFIRSLTGQGFLQFGQDSILHYIGIRDSILSRSRNPLPVVELKVKDQYEVTTEELKTAQTNWTTARSADNGAVAVTPAGIDVIVHGSAADTAMLAEARNAVRLDVANFANLNASLLDGNNGTSDNYSNTLQDKTEFVDLSLDTFLLPFEQRLSMPDVSDGLRFDRSPLEAQAPPATGNTGTAVERPAAPPAIPAQESKPAV
jgi:hypothetical protein